MKLFNIKFLFLMLLFTGCKNEKQVDTVSADISIQNNVKATLKINPISHATMVLNYGNLTFYVDPTGGVAAFDAYSKPDYVLITDIHGDHLNIKTLESLNLETSTIIAPQAVFDKLTEALQAKTTVINNRDKKDFKTFKIEAIPMYNLPEDETSRHPKGRGNGYVLTIGGERIYISGDTEDIPEMRNLTAIDRAFVCMNLPYTMSIEKAASAVLDFKPKYIYPYHYRGTEGLSDVKKFKTIVNNANAFIEVIQLDWYPVD